MPRACLDPAVAERQRIEQDTVRARVPSSSKPSEHYHVTLYAACTCPGWTYRQACRHTREALQSLARPEGPPDGHTPEGRPYRR